MLTDKQKYVFRVKCLLTEAQQINDELTVELLKQKGLLQESPSISEDDTTEIVERRVI